MTDGDSDPVPLYGSPASHEDIMAALLRSSHRTEGWRRTIEQRVTRLEDVQTAMLDELRTNTAETVAARHTIQDVRDGMTTVRTLRRVIVWVGGVAAAVAAVWALVTQARS